MKVDRYWVTLPVFVGKTYVGEILVIPVGRYEDLGRSVNPNPE